MSEPKKAIGDIHTHQFNKYAVPNNLSRQQAAGFSEGFINSFIGRFIGRIKYGKRFKEFLEILNCKTIAEVAEKQLTEMNQAGIDYSLVLAMDFSFVDPKYKRKKYDIPYSRQLEDIINNCAKYPFRFFPLYFYEPRRHNAQCLLKKAYEEYGIVGIKYYPAFGFDPRPDKKSFLEPPINLPHFEGNLRFLYEFAKDHNLPILTHCSAGGSYQCTIKKKEKYKKIWIYTEPSNFLNISKDKELRICFAHMGGSIYGKATRELATQWRNQLFNLAVCNKVDGEAGFKSESRFYMDTANVLCHSHKKKDKIKKHLIDVNKLLTSPTTRDYVIFGTDWPLGRHIYRTVEYCEYYRKGLKEENLDRFFSDNAARFLFGESKQIPPNYIEFLKKRNGGNVPDLPDFVREADGKYYLA